MVPLFLAGVWAMPGSAYLMARQIVEATKAKAARRLGSLQVSRATERFFIFCTYYYKRKHIISKNISNSDRIIMEPISSLCLRVPLCKVGPEF